MFLYFKMQSMATGPVALSTLIGSCAFIIATWFGVIYASEKISNSQLIGMILILVSLVLCVNPRKSAEKLSLKWFLYCMVFFFAGGFVGILYRLFGSSDVSEQVNTMMLTAAVVSAVLFFISGVFVNRAAKQGIPTIHKDAWSYIILSGIAGCIYIRLNIPLSNIIHSAVFFPVSNGSMMILSTLAGSILFKEKLSKVQLIGILLGIVAIIVIGCGDYLMSLLMI